MNSRQAVLPRNDDEAMEAIKRKIADCAAGGFDDEPGALTIAEDWELHEEWVRSSFVEARAVWAKAKASLEQIVHKPAPVDVPAAAPKAVVGRPGGIVLKAHAKPRPELEVVTKTAPQGAFPDRRADVREPTPVAKRPAFVGVRPERTPEAFSLLNSPSGIPTTYINARIGVANLGANCRYDTFHDRLIVAGFECSGNGDATENLDNVALKVRDAIIGAFKFDPGKNHVHDAIISLALDNQFDPVRDYLDGLQWDGVARLDTWLIDHLGVADTSLNRAIGRKMLIAAVRRVREPGCKFDHIVVLEGEQGSGRSTALKILAGGEGYFSDAEVIALWPKDRQEQVQGVWIYELAELAGYGKVDVNQFKNFVSQTVDRARPAYGRNRIDRPRRCIFVATTNDDNYLRDHTGNRRYWPVKLPPGFRIDLARLRAERDQLWAEASLAEAAVDCEGYPETLVIPEALWPEAAAQQAMRLETDPWEDRLRDLIVDDEPGGINANYVDGSQTDVDGNPEWRVSTSDLLTRVLEIPPTRQYPNHTKRLAGLMRTLGWRKRETPMRIKKKVCNGYSRPKDGV